MEIDITPDVSVLQELNEAKAMLSNAGPPMVATEDDKAVLIETLSRIKAAVKRAEAERKRLADPINRAKEALFAEFAPFLDWASGIEKQIKAAVVAYDQARAAEARAAQAKLDEIARKGREKLEAKARAAAAKGNEEKANAFVEKALSVAAPVVQAPEQVKGASTRYVTKITVTDRKMFLQAAIGNDLLMNYIVIDEGKLTKFVQSQDGHVSLPGITITKEAVLAVRSKVRSQEGDAMSQL